MKGAGVRARVAAQKKKDDRNNAGSKDDSASRRDKLESMGLASPTVDNLTEDHVPLKMKNFLKGVEATSIIQKHKLQHSKTKEIFKKIPVDENQGKYIINPQSPKKVIWDISVGALIFYSLIVIPFRIGFQSEPDADSSSAIFDIFIDCTFGVDIILNFNTAYIDTVTEKLVISRVSIVKNYMKIWFWIDFFSTIPIETIVREVMGGGGGDTSKLQSLRLIRITRLVRLLKLARVMKLSKLGVHMEALEINPALLNVIKLVFQIMFIAHIISCFWFFLTTSDVIGEVAYYDIFNNIPKDKITWATESGLITGTVFDQYVAAFYWTIATMVAVGYGDIHATNSRERLYAIFTMLCGGVMFGAVIAQVTKLIESRNPQARAFKVKMDEIKAYLGEKNLPQKLKSEAKEAYTYYLQRKSSFGESGIFDGLPTQILIRLVYNIYEKEIRKIRLFNRGAHKFVVQLVVHLQPFQAYHGETIFEDGDVAHEIVFVLRGMVRMSVNNGNRDIVAGYSIEGGYFGDFEYYKQSTRIAKYTAAINCNLMAINNGIFGNAVSENFECGKEFTTELKRRYLLFLSCLQLPVAYYEKKNGLFHTGNDVSDERSVEGYRRSRAMPTLRLKKKSKGLCREKLWVDGELKSPDILEKYNLMSELSDRNASLYRVIKMDSSNSKEVLIEESIADIGKRYILHPKGMKKIYWDIVIGVLIVYSILTIPIQIGFSTISVGGLALFEVIIDVLFGLDIFACCRTAYFSEDDDALVTISWRILKEYSKTWLVIDFLSCFPFDWFMTVIIGDGGSGLQSIKLVKTIRLFRLLKLARLVKLGKYVNKLEDMVGIAPATYDLIKMIIEVIFIGHLLACFWYGITNLMTVHTWFDDPNGNLNGSIRDEPLGERYVVALYWTFATLATVGYGDITSVNTSERAVNIFVMMVGATVFGYIVANVSTLMGTLNHSQTLINEKVSEVTEYLNEKNCPKDLAGVIIRHYKHMFNQQSSFDETGILGRLPRRISSEILLIQHCDNINKIHMFDYIENKFVALFIFKILTADYIDVNQYIAKEGSKTNEIYFLVSGRALIFHKKNVKKSLNNVSKNSSKTSSAKYVVNQTERKEGFLPKTPPADEESHLDEDDDAMQNIPYLNEKGSTKSQSFLSNILGSSKVAPAVRRSFGLKDIIPEELIELQTKKKGEKSWSGSVKGHLSDMVDSFGVKKEKTSDRGEVVDETIKIEGDAFYPDTNETNEANELLFQSAKRIRSIEKVVEFSKETEADMIRKGRIVVGEVSEGSLVGQNAFLHNSSHTASVRALTPISAFVINKVDIWRLIRDHPGVAIILQAALGHAIYHMNDEMGHKYAINQRKLFLQKSKDEYYKHKQAVIFELKKQKNKNFFGIEKPGSSKDIQDKNKLVRNKYFNKIKEKLGMKVEDEASADEELFKKARATKRWQVIKHAVKDARVHETVSNMKENLAKAELNDMDWTNVKSNENKKKSSLTYSMQSRMGVSIESILTNKNMNYDSDDEHLSDNSEEKGGSESLKLTSFVDDILATVSQNVGLDVLKSPVTSCNKSPKSNNLSTLKFRASQNRNHRSCTDLTKLAQDEDDETLLKKITKVTKIEIEEKKLTRRNSFPSLENSIWKNQQKNMFR
jgi:CRP-like cAMP-binding protein